jgi:putative DNA primase/helicase
MDQLPSVDSIRAALACIPATERATWVKVCFAIKSAYPGDTGLEIFDEWSAGASNYDAAAVRATWRNAKAGGKVTAKSLFFEAKRYGFDPKRYDVPAPLSREERARRDAQRQKRERAEAEAKRAAEQETAQAARLAWDAAAESGDAAYLTRKGVGAHGVRYRGAAALLIPLCDMAGMLWNIQTIFNHPADGVPGKVFMKGGRVTGCMHWIGDAEAGVVRLVAEGYATGATLHEATGLPVAVAFNAGNLEAVALAIRGRWPQGWILICADDDQDTAAEHGYNPGIKAAQHAAQAAQGAWIAPQGLATGQSDFNDLAAAVGTDSVRDQINGALAAYKDHGKGKDRAAGRTPAAGRQGGKAGQSAAGGGTARERPYYEVLPDGGVFFHGTDSKGNDLAPQWMCAPLYIRAHTRSTEAQDWGYLLTFKDRDGNEKRWAMPAELLHGDGAELAKLLSNQGLDVHPTPATRQRLASYIQQQARHVSERAISTDRIGWHGRAFVLPKRSFGDADQQVVFQSPSALPNTFQEVGTVADWRERVGALCAGNGRLVFAASCAFAGPLLRHASMESGGFHLRGNSSLGKSTAQRVAASVFGAEDFRQQWRSTDNALEATAAQHSDTLLILDELKQLDPKVAGECAYMLANEQGKARMSRTATPRGQLRWRLLFLSSGELSLVDHMQEAGKRAHAGQEVRLPDIPADAGAGLGLFNTPHGFADARTLAEHIKFETRAVYGAPGRAFIEWLVGRVDELPELITPWVARLVKSWVPPGASGQVERVASRFALVAVGGELASAAGITGWNDGEAEAGVKVCFDAWLMQRGGAGDGEEALILRQVRQFLEAHGEARFPWWHRSADDHKPNAMYRAGVRVWIAEDGERLRSKMDHYSKYGDSASVEQTESASCEYMVLPETFRGEVCRGFDPLAVAKLLHARGHLRTEGQGKSFKYARRERIPGIGKASVYCVLPSIFEVE